MDDYMKNYNNLTKTVIYNFKVGDGGIGDYLKFFMFALDICIKNNYKLYYLVNNIPLEKYLRLNTNNMYIKRIDLQNIIHLNDINCVNDIKPGFHYIIKPQLFYSTFDYNNITIPIQDVFYFTDEIISNSQLLCNYDNYISLHLRLGDKYLETDVNFVQCPQDTRYYDENKIFEFIENNQNENIIFFCDNQNYKLKLKEKYNNIIIINSEIGHTSLYNTTKKQILDSITEFYIVTNSNRIYSASNSGFSIVASLYKRIPLFKF
jgi:hypothetical protein